MDEYKLEYHELVDVPHPANERLNIENEWDPKTICKQIIDCGVSTSSTLVLHVVATVVEGNTSKDLVVMSYL